MTSIEAAGLVVRHVDAGRYAGLPFADPVRLDPNAASIAELALLPGIGRGRAAAIVLHRVRFGPFQRIEDLDAVDGIGPRTVERLRSLLHVD
ncbi:MAG: ComEA family DNA-binding protein [Planctomycetes bacterium]|nr:ComEA family DNA-binding protein [Planctomycetota bacterium]